MANDRSPVYSHDMLRAAMELDQYPISDSARYKAEGHSRTCGTRVRVSLDTNRQGQITHFGLSAQACAFGQASAAVVARHICGKNIDVIAEAENALSAFLHGSSDDIGDWPDIIMLAPAKNYPARRNSVLLPFRTVLKALDWKDLAEKKE